MVDRYAKSATENLAVAAARIESDRTNVSELSRLRHVRKLDELAEMANSLI